MGTVTERAGPVAPLEAADASSAGPAVDRGADRGLHERHRLVRVPDAVLELALDVEPRDPVRDRPRRREQVLLRHGRAGLLREVTRVRPGEETDRVLVEPTDRACASHEQGTAGLPVGVQVVGTPMGEHVVIALMAAIEAARRTASDWPTTPIDPR